MEHIYFHLIIFYGNVHKTINRFCKLASFWMNYNTCGI
jgi:hypothetical protein